MKWTRKILLGLTAGIIIAAGIGFYLFNKPVQSLEKSKPEYYVSASELNAAYNDDEDLANKKYLGKVIQINGEIKLITKGNHGMVVLSFLDPLQGVSCTFDSLQALEIKSFSTGDTITLKGRCDGRLSDVRISKCFLEESKNQ